MPELPEVQTIVSTLASRVVGRAIVGVPHFRADMVEPAGVDLRVRLSNRVITDLSRRAKRIVFTLDRSERFFIHLGMTGRLTLENPDAPIRPHLHLVIVLENGKQLRLVDPRRFGAIVWLGLNDHVGLGPEPLSLKSAQLAKILRGTSRAIKTALLDQALIAGIGNIYADEALHLARIHPAIRACDITQKQSEALIHAIKLVLRRAIRAGGSSIRDYVDANGSKGMFQTLHHVYDRAGAPCRTCKTNIVKIVLGGRSSHYCPACQPAPIKNVRRTTPRPQARRPRSLRA